jgi:molybdopterin-binding protein
VAASTKYLMFYLLNFVVKTDNCFSLTQMTRRCWPLRGLGVDEKPGIEMKNQVNNIKKGKSDIAIQLNVPAARLVTSAVFVASNDPINIRPQYSTCAAMHWLETKMFVVETVRVL